MAPDTLLKRELINPVVRVSIRGRPLDPDVEADVVEVIYRDTIDGLDSVELVLNNWDNETGTFRYQERADFDPPQEIDVEMGYGAPFESANGDTAEIPPLQHVISGEVVTLESRMRGPGDVTLHLRALNRLHGLRTEQRTRVYEGKTDSQIAREIVSRLQRVTLVGDNGAQRQEVAHPYLLQANQYDIVFLLERARRIGYDLWLEQADGGEGRLHFKPSPRTATSPLTLEWGRSLIEATLTLSTAGETSEVEVRAWDPMRKRAIVERASWSSLEVRGLPHARTQEALLNTALKGRREVVVDRPVQSAIEAKVLASRSLEALAKQLAVVRGTAIGTPMLRAGTRITLEGLGERYSGTYFVTQTTHRSNGNGYRTQFIGRLERT